MEIKPSALPLGKLLISSKKKIKNDLDFVIKFLDDGKNHKIDIESFTKWRKSTFSAKSRFKLKINIVREPSNDEKAFEFKINKNSFLREKHIQLYEDFIDDFQGYNMLLISIKYYDKLKDKIITERTGTAVTSNEEDDGDKKNRLELIND